MDNITTLNNHCICNTLSSKFYYLSVSKIAIRTFVKIATKKTCYGNLNYPGNQKYSQY